MPLSRIISTILIPHHLYCIIRITYTVILLYITRVLLLELLEHDTPIIHYYPVNLPRESLLRLVAFEYHPFALDSRRAPLRTVMQFFDSRRAENNRKNTAGRIDVPVTYAGAVESIMTPNEAFLVSVHRTNEEWSWYSILQVHRA